VDNRAARRCRSHLVIKWLSRVGRIVDCGEEADRGVSRRVARPTLPASAPSVGDIGNSAGNAPERSIIGRTRGRRPRRGEAWVNDGAVTVSLDRYGERRGGHGELGMNRADRGAARPRGAWWANSRKCVRTTCELRAFVVVRFAWHAQDGGSGNESPTRPKPEGAIAPPDPPPVHCNHSCPAALRRVSGGGRPLLVSATRQERAQGPP
jgi:hypothetical protein